MLRDIVLRSRQVYVYYKQLINVTTLRRRIHTRPALVAGEVGDGPRHQKWVSLFTNRKT